MASTLTLARSEATSLLMHQLGEGQRLLALAVADYPEFVKVGLERSAWSLRNRQLLFKLFEDNSGIAGYRGIAPISNRASLPLQIEHFREELRAHLACLQNVLERVG